MKNDDIKKLNVFKMCPYSPWKYPSNWFRNIKQFFRYFKWGWQRATKGYCEYDLFAFDDYYLNLIAETLFEMAKTTQGYPGPYESLEEWQQHIHDLGNEFKEAADILWKEYDDDWDKNDDKLFKDDFIGITPIRTILKNFDVKAYKDFDDKKDKMIMDAFKHFAKDLRNLWD